MADDQLMQLADLTTPGVSDALDQCGIPGQCQGIMPLCRSLRLTDVPGLFATGRSAMTPGTVGDYIDDIEPEQVVVLDYQGRLDATRVGRPADDCSSGPLRRRNSDRRSDPRYRSQHRAELSDFQPRQLDADRKGPRPGGGNRRPGLSGRIRVEPGGIPAGRRRRTRRHPGLISADVVIPAAIEIERAEQSIRDALTDGRSLRSAREAVGYHSLQRRRTKSDNSATRDTNQA